VLSAISQATNKATMTAAKALVAQLRNDSDVTAAVAAFNARAATLKQQAQQAPADSFVADMEAAERDAGKTAGASMASK